MENKDLSFKELPMARKVQSDYVFVPFKVRVGMAMNIFRIPSIRVQSLLSQRGT